MIVLHDGKLRLLTATLFGFKIELDCFVTDDCSTRLSSRGRFILRVWKSLKLVKKKTWYFNLKYKDEPCTENKSLKLYRDDNNS